MNYQYLPIYVIFIALPCSYYFGYTPPMVLVAFIVASILAYMAYAKDKSAAQNGEWRVPENTLHLYSLLCGWPGAIIAQQKLRHKTKKTSFRLVFWLTLFMNIGAFSWLHTHDGSRVLHSYTYKLENIFINKVGNNNVTRTILLLTRFRKNVRFSIYKS